MKKDNKQNETTIECKTSKTNEAKPSLLDCCVFQDGFPVNDPGIDGLPKDMSDPESWKKIAQICKDKELDIICFLDEKYKGSSIMVFKRSGNYLFFRKGMSEQAIAYAKSDEVYVLSVSIDGHEILVYYVWDGNDTGYLLYTWEKLYNDDTEENHIDVYESFGIMANELILPLLDQAERF